VTAVLAISAAIAAVQAAGGSATWVTEQFSGRTAVLVALTALATWLTWLVLAVLPRTLVRSSSRREA
jgi:hypothetical protein